MKRIVTSAVGIAVAAVAASGLLAGAIGSASAVTTPPWEPDHGSVGGLTFYNSAGTKITGGSTSAPLAAYTEGGTTVRGGDNVATLFGYLPVHGQAPGQWSGEQLSGSTGYPNSSAPGALGGSSHPVVTAASGDETVAQLVSDYPNTDSSSDGYAHTYQIRLLTSKPQEGISTTYDSADIVISGSNWSVLYTAGPSTPTTTKLSVSPSGGVHQGESVKLKATVSPAAARGAVQFRDGSKVLKTATVSAGVATFTDSSLAGGKHSLTARFVPGSSSYGASTSTAHSVKVVANAIKVKLKASKSSIPAGKKLTLTVAEKPAVAGKVSFLDGSKRLGKVAVKKGKATLSTTKLKAGRHSLKAKFTPASKSDGRATVSKAVKVKVTK